LEILPAQNQRLSGFSFIAVKSEGCRIQQNIDSVHVASIQVNASIKDMWFNFAKKPFPGSAPYGRFSSTFQ